jgi:glycosyltransferase involved in cell wall biosynthesis
MSASITVHCVIRNEERFAWYAINSVLPYVDTVLVYDTGSTDRTREVVKSIKSPKLVFKECGEVSKQEFFKLRQKQIEITKTDWILVLDGDEIWPEAAIKTLVAYLKSAPKNITSVAVYFDNFVNDVFHYQPSSEGGYQIAGKKGNITIRAMRNIPGLHVTGDYGIEGYYNGKGTPIQNETSKISVLDVSYLHASNLVRSSSILSDWKIGYRRMKIFVGTTGELRPENDASVRNIFAKPVPVINFSPLKVDWMFQTLRILLMPALMLRKLLKRHP